MIKAVIFDMDDTLFNEMDFVKSGFKAVDQHLQGNQIYGFYKEALNLLHAGHSGTIFNKTLENLEIKHDKRMIMELLTIYRAHKPHIQLYPDVLSILKEVQQTYKVGLITDGYLITQKNKAAALRLEEYMDFLVFSDEYGRESWKPSETPYKKVMEHFDLLGNECIYIGDNPTKDFITARKLGWNTVQIIRENGVYKDKEILPDHEADFHIHSFSEIPALISGISKA